MDDNGLSTSADPGHPTGVGALRKLQPMTARAFLDWDNDDRSGRHWQLRDGQPEVTAPATGIVPRARRAESIRIPALVVTCARPDFGPLLADPVLVAEFLVVSATERRVELLRRGMDGNWPGEPAMIGPGETLDLASIGLTVMLDGLYRTTALA